jgi:hypothetical protein
MEKNMNENNFWDHIKSLQGSDVLTLTDGQKNRIQSVEDTGSKTDQIFIDGRDSFPNREDLWTAYQLLILQKKLTRSPDLAWLSDKKVSSISFAILATVPGVNVEGKGKAKPILRLA